MLDTLLETTGTPGVLGSPAATFGKPSADAIAGDRTIFLHIEETVTIACLGRIEAVLYAHLDNQQVAALDFIRSDQGVCVNMVFVRPGFRRRGIGSALVQHLITQYPGMNITCASRSVGSAVPGPTA